jgi:hypothetical protein
VPVCVMPGRALDVCAGLLENIVSFAEGGKSVGMFLRNTLANHAQFSDVINVCTGCVCGALAAWVLEFFGPVVVAGDIMPFLLVLDSFP